MTDLTPKEKRLMLAIQFLIDKGLPREALLGKDPNLILMIWQGVTQGYMTIDSFNEEDESVGVVLTDKMRDEAILKGMIDV